MHVENTVYLWSPNTNLFQFHTVFVPVTVQYLTIILSPIPMFWPKWGVWVWQSILTVTLLACKWKRNPYYRVGLKLIRKLHWNLGTEFRTFNFTWNIWDKVFKNGPSKNCGRQSWSGIVCFKQIKPLQIFEGCLAQILLGPFLNTLFHILWGKGIYAFAHLHICVLWIVVWIGVFVFSKRFPTIDIHAISDIDIDDIFILLPRHLSLVVCCT